jgi:pyrroloquinoline quinone biosynthesis protein B
LAQRQAADCLNGIAVATIAAPRGIIAVLPRRRPRWPALHPKPGLLRHTPIAGVVLTNGEVDAIAGLLSLRESSPFTIFAHRRVLDILAANSIFNVLDPAFVARSPIEPDVAFEAAGLMVTPFAAPGKPALFLEGSETAEQPGDTLGLMITDCKDRRLVVLAACAQITPEIAARLDGATAVFFDGTLWRDDEMIQLGLGKKTGQRMGHVSMGPAIAALADIDIGRRFFLHINNSNPAWRPGSAERNELERQGWTIPANGMEVTL